MQKLNQLIAVDKAVRERANEQLTSLGAATAQPALVTGLRKEYQPLLDGGETYPTEVQKVQFNFYDVVVELRSVLVELYDITARKDWSNCVARADIRVGDQLLVPQAPVHFILFLSKQLAAIRTIIEKMVVRDPAKDWDADPDQTGVWKTKPIRTQRTRKTQRPLVKYEATPQHPAQVELITVDSVAGEWSALYYSGAIPPATKKALMWKIDRVTDACKMALEEANSCEASTIQVGSAILEYVFGP